MGKTSAIASPAPPPGHQCIPTQMSVHSGMRDRSALMFLASEAVSAAVRCQPDYSHHRVTGAWTDIRGGPNMTRRAETGRIQAPRQIKPGRAKNDTDIKSWSGDLQTEDGSSEFRSTVE